MDTIFIDIGAKDKKEVEKMGVHVGCVITYPDKFHILNKNKFVCRAIDNRAGGFMIAEVARLLFENKKKLPVVCIYLSGRDRIEGCRNDYPKNQT